MVLLKLTMRLSRILADPNDLAFHLYKIFHMLRKFLGFYRAARSIIFRIKIKHGIISLIQEVFHTYFLGHTLRVCIRDNCIKEIYHAIALEMINNVRWIFLETSTWRVIIVQRRAVVVEETSGAFSTHTHDLFDNQSRSVENVLRGIVLVARHFHLLEEDRKDE